MADERMADEEVLKAAAGGALSDEQRAALGRVLARLQASEKVCLMVGDSLSPKRRAEKGKAGKHAYWFDVAGAVNEWEKLSRP